MSRSIFIKTQYFLAIFISAYFIYVSYSLVHSEGQIISDSTQETETIDRIAKGNSYTHRSLFDGTEWSGEVIAASNNARSFEIFELSLKSVIENAYTNKLSSEDYSANYFDVNRDFLITQLATSSKYEGGLDQLDFYNFKALYVADETGLLGTALPLDDLITQKNRTFSYYFDKSGNKVDLQIGKEYLFISPFINYIGNVDGVFKKSKILFVGFYIPVDVVDFKDGTDVASINKISHLSLQNTVSNYYKGHYEEIVLVASDHKYYSLGSVTQNKYGNYLVEDKSFCYVTSESKNEVSCLDLNIGRSKSLQVPGDTAQIFRMDKVSEKLIVYVREECNDSQPAHAQNCLKVYVSEFNLDGDLQLIFEGVDGYEKGSQIFVSELSSDLSTARMINNVSYECRQMYKEFFYDVKSKEVLQIIDDLDNDCSLDENSIFGEINDLRKKNIFSDRPFGQSCPNGVSQSRLRDIICF